MNLDPSVSQLEFRKRMRVIWWLLSINIIFLLQSSAIEVKSEAAELLGIEEIRTIDLDEVSVSQNLGFAYSQKQNRFFVVAGNGTSGQIPSVVVLSPYEEKIIDFPISERIGGPLNMTVDDYRDQLLMVDRMGKEIVFHSVADEQSPETSTSRLVDMSRFELSSALGVQIDESGDFLWVLDGAAHELVRVEILGQAELGEVERFILPAELRASQLQGLAYHPQSGYFYTASQSQKRLYEISTNAELINTYDLSGLGLHNTLSLSFGLSTDLTDAPETIHLFIADSSNSGTVEKQEYPVSQDLIYQHYLPFLEYPERTNASIIGDEQLHHTGQLDSHGKIFEISLGETINSVQAAMAARSTYLVQTVDLSSFSPPSPDSAGVAYFSNIGRLMISDSEVNEISQLFTGDNLFEVALNGSLVRSATAFAYTNEPTGVGFNPSNEHMFISDDNAKEIYEIRKGGDGLYGTSDDIVTSFDTAVFSSMDPEGVTYDLLSGDLFIVDGVNDQVYRVNAGSNGIFDGIPASGGDDAVSDFDTGSLGIDDPEGIHADEHSGNLFVTGRSSDVFFEVSPTGTLVHTYDVSALPIEKVAGITIAPGSQSPTDNNFYLVDRGIDNNDDPNENDGALYELTITTINVAPTTYAGPDQTIALPSAATLDGTVSDDGLPSPPASIDVAWSKISGPGTVTFIDQNSVDTTASFSLSGTYVLRLTANDSVLSSSDDVEITVNEDAGTLFVNLQVQTSNDDAEEATSGSVSRGSSDLELVENKGDPQIVGIRFVGIDVPKDAIIENATVQFQVDETSSNPTNLILRGQYADNPNSFTGSSGNISLRPTTAASVSWSPLPWTSIGAAGPDQKTPNLAAIVQEIINRPGWQNGNAMVLLITGSGERTAESYNGDQSGAPRLQIEYRIANQQKPIVDAGPDRNIEQPNPAILDGTVTDDGLPNPPALVTTTWSKVSGPGTASFANPNAIDTSVTFSLAGTYVLRLSADDSELSAFDEMTVIVTANQSPPTVDAGPDLVVTLPNSASLDGTVTDDGQPNPPGAVSVTWSKEDGPGGVTFSNENAVDTTASFGSSGVYRLRLTANDGELTTFDELVVTVSSTTGSVTEVVQIGAGSDDAEERHTGNVSLSSTDLEFVFDSGGAQTVGMRFNNLNVPQGSLINSAHIQFQVDESNSGATSLTILGEAIDNAVTFSRIDGNITGRIPTVATVAWSPNPWTTVGAAGADQRTPDIAAILQEIVNRPGWVSGNSVVIMISGTGERTAEAYDGNASAAAKLHVEYTP